MDLLQMQRHRVIDEAADARLLQVIHDVGATIAKHRVLVIHGSQQAVVLLGA